MQQQWETLLAIGVLQVEAMAQLGGLLMIDPENETAKNNFFFGGVDNCKWRRPVVPGDCLVICTPCDNSCLCIACCQYHGWVPYSCACASVHAVWHFHARACAIVWEYGACWQIAAVDSACMYLFIHPAGDWMGPFV